MIEDSGEFETNRHERSLEHHILLGQLLEGVKGLRREIGDLRLDLAEQKTTTTKLMERVEEFERMVQQGRGIMVGLGLASMGVGAGVTKLMETLWPS